MYFYKLVGYLGKLTIGKAKEMSMESVNMPRIFSVIFASGRG